jgi:hypothetical protein
VGNEEPGEFGEACLVVGGDERGCEEEWMGRVCWWRWVRDARWRCLRLRGESQIDGGGGSGSVLRWMKVVQPWLQSWNRTSTDH